MQRIRSQILLPIIFVIITLLFGCGGELSFQKISNKPSIAYSDLEAYYLENSPKVSEPIMPEDEPIYQIFKDILYLSDQAEIRASLNAVEYLLAHDVSENYKNVVSLYLLLGQYNEHLLEDGDKALAIYQKVWQEYQSTPFLHPFFNPKKKELTNEWYLLYSDAEAILKAGNIYLRTERPKAALKCYKRILRYYGDDFTGSYSYDFPDRYGRVVTAKIVKIEPVKMPDVEPVRSYSGDRREEFIKLAQTLPADLVKRDINKFVGYISFAGAVIGYDRYEKKWTDHDVVVYQLQHKMGPQYDMLFGWVRSLKAQADEIIVRADREGANYEAVLSHPKLNSSLHLSFRPIDTIWYITGISLY